MLMNDQGITMKVQKVFTGFITLLIFTGFTVVTGCSKKIVRTGSGKTVDAAGNTVTSPEEILKYTGTYRVELPGYKGILTLRYNRESGKSTGEILFPGWGTGKPQPLKKLSIKDDRIYFERSVETAAELREYGGSRYFRQKYYGKFSRDRSEVKGEFTDSGAVYNWRAGRQGSRD